MAQWWSLSFFLFCVLQCGNIITCFENKIKIWSSTKCVAGRSFFARFDRIPGLYRTFSKKPIQPYTFPWISEVHVSFYDKEEICTGTLINDRYILTAQHCVLPPNDVKNVTIKLGYYNGYASDKPAIFQPQILEREVLEIIRYSNYTLNDSKSFENDLVLLRITPVKYGKTIYPIQLPYLTDKYKTYSNFTAENVNWVPSDNNTKRFKQRQVTIIDSDHCLKTNIKSNILCAITNKDDKGDCQTETGGPLMLEDENNVYKRTVLLGIASWSSKNQTCPQAQFPMTYVRIDSKLKWIKQNTKDAAYCNY